MSVKPDLLTKLEPIAALSPGRVEELAGMCVIETVSQGLNPFRMNVVQSEQLLYLVAGDLKVTDADGVSMVLQGGSEPARHPVASEKPGLKDAAALNDIQILRIDADLLDIMLTWDQLAGYENGSLKSTRSERSTGEWMRSTGAFSAESLKSGIFRAFPPANIEEMFRRMERIPVEAGQVIIRQGDEGDYYYLIQEGAAKVMRTSAPAQPEVQLATLQPGQAFGEEALISGNKRNATIIMATDGVLLRLGKDDFMELLKKPLLHEVDRESATLKVRAGAQLVDVRTPAEFDLKHHTGAINIPLQDIREAMGKLDKTKEYLVYCQTGRRAAAATFILAQHGYKAMALSA